MATKGNFNNEIGLPLTLLDADASTDVLVVEMGMRGPGEIRALARLARPHVGVVTNVSAVHLERLGTVGKHRRWPNESSSRRCRADGVAVLNGDDPSVRAMAHQAPGRRAVFRSRSRQRRLGRRTCKAWASTAAASFCTIRGGRPPVELPVPGRHHVMNALAAAAAAFALGFDVDDVARGLAAADRRRAAMRTEVWTTPDGVRVINDAYNAGPAVDGRGPGTALGDAWRASCRRGWRHAGAGRVGRQAHARVGRAVAGLGIDLLDRRGSMGLRRRGRGGVRGHAGRTNQRLPGRRPTRPRLAARLVRPG